MSSNSAYQQMIVKVNTVYEPVEGDISNELMKLAHTHSSITANLNLLKDKHDVLSSLVETCFSYPEDSLEIKKIREEVYQKICEHQLILRLLQEKEILLYGYIINLNHIEQFPIPSIVELNREYKVRKKKIECELLSSFLIEEYGYEKFRDIISDANNALDRAIDLGDIHELSAAENLYQELFSGILEDKSLALDLKNKFAQYREHIEKQIDKIHPLKNEETLSLETIQKTFSELKHQRQEKQKLVEKLLYQFFMLHMKKKVVNAELREVRKHLQTLVFKEHTIQRNMNQLQNDQESLFRQKQQFLDKPSLPSYDEALNHLNDIEKKLKHMLYKVLPEKNDAKDLKFNFQDLLEAISNNDSISIQHKRSLVRLAKDSILVNTHTGKFFFQRSSKSGGSRYFLDELESRFNQLTSYSLQH